MPRILNNQCLQSKKTNLQSALVNIFMIGALLLPTLLWSGDANRQNGAEVIHGFNLGITGMRAKFEGNNNFSDSIKGNFKTLVITYVYKETPAFGKIQTGDVIVGVNNRPFQTPYVSPWSGAGFFPPSAGPQFDFGNALEESQKKTDTTPTKKTKESDKGPEGKPGNGKLILDVIRDKKNIKVVLDIGTKYGAYSDSAPLNCPKTDLIVNELYEYLAKEQDANGRWQGAEATLFAGLALLASGNKKYLPNCERTARSYASVTRIDDDVFSPAHNGSLACWGEIFAGTYLSEYYLATNEKWVLPELEKVRDWLMKAQFTDKSSQNLTADEDYKKDENKTRQLGGWGHSPLLRGYGPMCCTTGQAAMTLSLMTRCGIKVDRVRHDMALDFLDRGTGINGYVWYAAELRKNTSNNWADMGRNAVTSLANELCTYGDVKYGERSELTSKILSEHPVAFPQTHGSTLWGMGWYGAAARLQPGGLSKLMAENRWFFNLSQCCDGSFYHNPPQFTPDHDDSAINDRYRLHSMSAVMAFLLSVKNKNLHCTGAASQGKSFQLPTMDLTIEQTTRKTQAIYKMIATNGFPQALIAIKKMKSEIVEKPENINSKKEDSEKDLAVLDYFEKHISRVTTALKEHIDYLNSVGDIYQVSVLLNDCKKVMTKLPAFDELADPYFTSFKTDAVKSEIEAGKAFYAALIAIQPKKETGSAQAKDTKDVLLPLEKFIKKYTSSIYTPVAQAIVDELRKYPLTTIQPKRFFKIINPVSNKSNSQ